MDDTLDLMKKKETIIAQIGELNEQNIPTNKEVDTAPLIRNEKAENATKTDLLGFYNVGKIMDKYLYGTEDENGIAEFDTTAKIERMELLSDKENIKRAVPAQYMGFRGHRKAGTRASYAKKAAAKYEETEWQMERLATFEKSGILLDSKNGEKSRKVKEGTLEYRGLRLALKLNILDARLSAVTDSIMATSRGEQDESGKLSMARLKINACKVNAYMGFLREDTETIPEALKEKYCKRVDELRKDIEADRKKVETMSVEQTGYKSRKEIEDKEYNAFIDATPEGCIKMSREDWDYNKRLLKWSSNRVKKIAPYKKRGRMAIYGMGDEFYNRCIHGFLSKDLNPAPETAKAEKQYMDALEANDTAALGKFCEQVALGLGKLSLNIDEILKQANSSDVEMHARIFSHMNWTLCFTKTSVMNYYTTTVPPQLQELANKKFEVYNQIVQCTNYMLLDKNIGENGSIRKHEKKDSYKVYFQGFYEAAKAGIEQYKADADKLKNEKLLDKNGNPTEKTLGQAYPDFFVYNRGIEKEITLKPIS